MKQSYWFAIALFLLPTVCSAKGMYGKYWLDGNVAAQAARELVYTKISKQYPNRPDLAQLALKKAEPYIDVFRKLKAYIEIQTKGRIRTYNSFPGQKEEYSNGTWKRKGNNLIMTVVDKKTKKTKITRCSYAAKKKTLTCWGQGSPIPFFFRQKEPEKKQKKK